MIGRSPGKRGSGCGRKGAAGSNILSVLRAGPLRQACTPRSGKAEGWTGKSGGIADRGEIPDSKFKIPDIARLGLDTEIRS